MQYFGFDRPSFAFKVFSFGESSPKLQADFTTGTYKASGASKTFADLFTFNRAGKAWLVKDTGLQEYAVDAPRFDDGLLIERESTNHISNSLLGSTDGKSNVSIKLDNTFLPSLDAVIRLEANASESNVRYMYNYTSVGLTTWSAYFRTKLPNVLVGFDIFGRYNPSTGELTNRVGVSITGSKYKGWSYVAARKDGNTETSYNPSATTGITEDDYLDLALRQAENGEPSSYILTTTSPVTRPADFLLNKITGTTVTGDWDSTLNLSIVDGQLVHSGYGRIRSLEIN